MDTGQGDGDGEINWETGIDVCALPCVKQRAGGSLLHRTGSSAWCSVVMEMDGMGVGEDQEEGAVCIHRADSCHCTAEVTTL